ncbi:MAG: hypothetical protein DRN81_04425 [Thermoproteota archaeon]|nr:MAG: hypothetical protein DRN81_04425 [Candidatus Korarchaeota archaeon]
MELVEIGKDDIFCDSSMVARKFRQKHKDVVKKIKKLQEDIGILRGVSNPPKVVSEQRVYRGAKYTAYLMNRAFFSLLAMRFKGVKALEWQVKFNDAFYEMEKTILQAELNKEDQGFLQLRDQGKIARRVETDVIKEFVEYATGQGSRSAQYYYKHITNATYKALGLIVQRKPKVRDSLKGYEVAELMLVERLAVKALKKYMKLGRNYKDIYESVKDDLINYGGTIRIGIKE